MLHPARRLALDLLRQLEQGGFSNRRLAAALDGAALERRDRALVTNLVYGVLRHRARLDALIDAVASKPARLRGRTRTLLRMATFELRELGAPIHVVASQAVAAASLLDRKGPLRRVVQGIVCELDRRGAELDAAHEADPRRALRDRWSIPTWLARRFVTQLGEERALARARALAAPCPVDLRVDLSRITREEVRARLIEDGCSDHIEAPEAFPTVLRVHAGGRLDAHPLHEDGRFSIQALGAQQAAIMLSPRTGERILDACAGMGTKTLQLAELMARRGAIVAADRSAARLAEQARARARGGLDAPGLTVRVVEADLTGDAPEVDGDGLYDGVLLDAPCTGLGNLARHPERRWAAAAEDIADCAALQARLLARCWQRVRPGGRLVYAVCSLEPEEGPALVAAFAKEHGLQVIREETYTPEEHGADGFYAARIEGR